MSEKIEVDDVFQAAYDGFFTKKSTEIITVKSKSDQEILDAGFPIDEGYPGDIVKEFVGGCREI